MDTEKQRRRRRDDARLTESGNARSEQLNTCGAYRVANQQSLACLSGSERRRPGWILDMKYQTCFLICYRNLYHDKYFNKNFLMYGIQLHYWPSTSHTHTHTHTHARTTCTHTHTYHTHTHAHTVNLGTGEGH